jgi:aminoglycoside 6'-N-acetyltransferase
MHQWLNSQIVKQWYGKHDLSYHEIAEKYTAYIGHQLPTDPFLIMWQELPIGYIQTYRIIDYPNYNKYIQAEDTANGVDLFIGEATYINKGFGAVILTKFLREIVFGSSAAESCIVGPEPKNTRAIKTYEKVGFRYWKTIKIPNEPEPEYLMVITREEILGKGN